MASAALEKSLDEIIGDRPSTERRRGSGRPSRGSRPTPYRRDSRNGRDSRDNYRPQRDERASDDSRWAHDRYDRRRSYQDSNVDDDRSYRGQRDGRDNRSTRLRVSNIHYDLSESEVRDLFERIAPVARFSMQFDRAGRSEGLAFVTYDRYADAKSAISQYDGQSALGQRLEVEIEEAGPPARRGGSGLANRISNDVGAPRDRAPGSDPRPRGGRGRDRGPKTAKSASSARRGPVTAEDLDAELDNYINQRNGTSETTSEAQGGKEDTDNMLVD